MKKAWWKELFIYQIYVRSFFDSNGDGIGDLKGIIQKLDYLKFLGVEAIWLSPFYDSPNKDNGYDIRDYRKILNEFGTMNDFENLLHEVKIRDIKFIMDIALNHSSSEHRWFKESRKSKDNPYRNFYIWRDGNNNSPPNDLASCFEGSAWEFDNKTGQYYLKLFSKDQPDLNWESQEMKKEIFEEMKFWLNKGIDGFRLDVINYLSKDTSFGPVGCEPFRQYANGPKILDYLNEIKSSVFDGFHGTVAIGETPHASPVDGGKYTAKKDGPLDMVIHFDLMLFDCEDNNFWNYKKPCLITFKNIVNKWQQSVWKSNGWVANYLSNHDQPRMVSRFGCDKKFRKESAKMLATLNFSLLGTPYVYQGEEIGMTNVSYDKIDDYNDIWTKNFFNEENRKGVPLSHIMDKIYSRSRDNSRTPMQWNDSPNGGFTTGKPWLKSNKNYKTINVENSLSDPQSILHYYKKLIALRKSDQTLIYGNFILLDPENDKLFAFIRSIKESKRLVLLNFSDESIKFQISDYKEFKGCNHFKIILSNYDKVEFDIKQVSLQPYQSVIFNVKKTV